MLHRSLTPRQAKVLAETARRGSRKSAATYLGISKHTVDSHLERAKRCGCRSDLELFVVHQDEVFCYLERGALSQ